MVEEEAIARVPPLCSVQVFLILTSSSIVPLSVAFFCLKTISRPERFSFFSPFFHFISFVVPFLIRRYLCSVFLAFIYILAMLSFFHFPYKFFFIEAVISFSEFLLPSIFTSFVSFLLLIFLSLSFVVLLLFYFPSFLKSFVPRVYSE